MKNTSEKAIIGFNGYIGSYLTKKIKFKFKYNSKNISLLKKKKFNEAYIAAPHSLKYWAIKNPTKDTNIVDNFIENLKNLKTKKIIYFSSTDIYTNKHNVNENSKIIKKNLNIYGYNRLRIEKYIIKNFKNYLIIRLPALFGWNLKKNFFYDLLNSKKFKFYNKNTFLQWYCIEWLDKDLKVIKKKKINLINLVSEPVSLNEITNYLGYESSFSKTKPIITLKVFM